MPRRLSRLVPSSLAAAVLLLAAHPLHAQRVTVVPPDPCPYDACAVRVEPRLFGGATLVRGGGFGQVDVARVGFTGAAVARALSTHAAAAADAKEFRNRQTGASIAGLVGGAAFLYLTISQLDEQGSPDASGNDVFFSISDEQVTALVIGVGAGIFAGIEKYRADRALSRAVWQYNRGTTHDATPVR